ncbi:hypothetical protein [Chlorella virus XW01]|nr:hypothetical protein [Chlorella virus XW01]
MSHFMGGSLKKDFSSYTNSSSLNGGKINANNTLFIGTNTDICGNIIIHNITNLKSSLNVDGDSSFNSNVFLNNNIISDVSNIIFTNNSNYFDKIFILDTSINNVETIINNLDISTNNIESRVDLLDISTNIVESRVDLLDISMNNIESRVDLLDISTNIVESRLDLLDISTNIVESRVDLLDISTNNIESRVDLLDISMNNIESRVDLLDISMNNTVNRLDVIDIDNLLIDEKLDDLYFDKYDISGGLINGNVEINGNLTFINNGNNVMSFSDFSSNTQNVQLPSIHNNPVSLTRISIFENDISYNLPLGYNVISFGNIIKNQLNLSISGNVISPSIELSGTYVEIYANIKINAPNNTRFSLDISGIDCNFYEILGDRDIIKVGTYYVTLGPHMFQPYEWINCQNFNFILNNYGNNAITIIKSNIIFKSYYL